MGWLGLMGWQIAPAHAATYLKPALSARYEEFFFPMDYGKFVNGRTNTLVVTTGACLCAETEKLITQLDKTLPQDLTLVRYVPFSVSFYANGLDHGDLYLGAMDPEGVRLWADLAAHRRDQLLTAADPNQIPLTAYTNNITTIV